MGNTLTKPAPTDAQSSVSALAQYADDQDPFKQAVISALDAMVKERAAEQKAAAEREKTLTDKIAELDARNKSLAENMQLGTHSPTLQLLSGNPFARAPLAPRKRQKVKVKSEPSDSYVPPSSTSAPTCQLTGTLAVLPTEVLQHIFSLLHDEFHDHDRLNALAGIADPDPLVYPKPWNPVSLQRVNKLFREIATPLFYAQIALDSGRPQAITLLEMNFVAAQSTIKEQLGLQDGFSEDDDEILARLTGRKKRKQPSTSPPRPPVFKPAVKRLVIFLREDPVRTSASSFMSALESIEENISDKYSFLRTMPSRKAERHRPLEEVLLSTKGWNLPSFECAPTVTIVPREVSGGNPSGSWYNGIMLFNTVERGSKPNGRGLGIERGQRLLNLRFRLPKSTAADPESNQANDLKQIKKNYHKLTYCRTVRLDFPFSVANAKIVAAIEGIVRSPALAAAKHFYDGKRQKITLAVLDKAEADELRRKVDEFGVEDKVEVVVEVL